MRPPLSAGNMDLKKGTWSPEEDQKLMAYIRRYGIWNWSEMPKAAGLLRSGKSCRLRWMNYLRPDIKHGNFTKDEEETILNLYEKLGSRWSTMAKSLPGRTDNEIKNHFNTYLRKKYLKNKALQTEVHREHQTPKLESKEMSSSSSNNLSVLLMSPKESNCGSDMEIPSFNLAKEEIRNNGNQTKMGANNVGLFETRGELQSSREIEQQFSMEEEMCRLAADNQAIFSDGQLWFEESTVCQYGPPSIAATASNSTTTEGSKGIPFSPNLSTDNFPPSSFNLGSEINNNQQTKADHMMSLLGSSAEQGAPQNLCWEEPLLMEDFYGAFMYTDQMWFEESNYPFGSY